MKKVLMGKLNSAGGYDLLTERDSGNEILILTGKTTNSLDYWKRLQILCTHVIYEMEHSHPQYSKKIING
jgi:hypothetical protein